MVSINQSLFSILVGAISSILIQLQAQRINFINQYIFKSEEKIFKREK